MSKDEPEHNGFDAEFRGVFQEELQEVEKRRAENDSEGFLDIKYFLEYCKGKSDKSTRQENSENKSIESITPLEAIQNLYDEIEQDRKNQENKEEEEKNSPVPSETNPEPSNEAKEESLSEKKAAKKEDSFNIWQFVKFSPQDPQKPKTLELPAIHRELIGLSFSGGGIRSATFNLGVLQALHKCKMIKHIDYLSTVSGGGYIGSCLSSIYAHQSSLFTQFTSWVSGFLRKYSKSSQPTTGSAVNFPFDHKAGTPESVTFKHLRNNSNYLAPKGVLDFLMIPALVLRGMVLNFLIIIPYVIVAVLYTALFISPPDRLLDYLLDYDQIKDFLSAYASISEILGGDFMITKTLFIFTVFFFSLYPLLLRLAQNIKYLWFSEWQARNQSGKIFALMLGLIGLVAFIEFQPYAIIKFKEIITLLRDDWSFEWMSVGGALTAYLINLFSINLPQKASGLIGKIGIVLVGILGFLFFWVIYLTLSYWLIYPYLAPDWLKSLASFLTELKYIKEYLKSIDSLNFPVDIFFSYAIVAIVLWIYSFLFFDINDSSMHNFYRDRLSKAYLFSWDGKNEVQSIQHKDEQKLSGLGRHSPYHLINCALNVKNPEESFQKGRHADFFIFSKLFIGGKLTGYCRTEDMEAIRPHVNLGTAMAISGAAAAPNMGKSTFKPLTFILAMLNIRLNYWLPNPGKINQNSSSDVYNSISTKNWAEKIAATAHMFKEYFNWFKNNVIRPLIPNPINRVGPYYLILEMFGWLDAKSWNVNVSDGGHIENLGMFELLRRECRLIIACDGECDPGLKFDAVSEVTRLARIDLGIKITLEGLDLIREGKQQHAIGTIKYKNGRKGVLIYLKSSLLGDNSLRDALKEDFYQTSNHRNDNLRYDDNPYVAHYKAKHPSFPHETTGDQFFDETQFECYRALGFNVTLNTFTL
jgi:hypothetical protein